MAAELQKSQFAHDTLKESTAALAQLSETYSTLDTLLSSSKNLLGTLLRSQKSDTWYLETAFYILAATVAWLIFRRILYGPLYYPVYWLFWFLSIPLKMFIKGWLGIFAALGLTGGQNAEAGVTSVVSSSPTVSHRTAGRLSAPSGARTPPGVNVGGGGKGAPMHSQGPPAGQGNGGSVSDQVGRIIDESKEQETQKEGEEGTPENETAEEPRNPKKRMWEEDKEAAKEEQRKKDEL
jgi:protein transport protein SEC20